MTPKELYQAGERARRQNNYATAHEHFQSARSRYNFANLGIAKLVYERRIETVHHSDDPDTMHLTGALIELSQMFVGGPTSEDLFKETTRWLKAVKANPLVQSHPAILASVLYLNCEAESRKKSANTPILDLFKSCRLENQNAWEFLKAILSKSHKTIKPNKATFLVYSLQYLSGINFGEGQDEILAIALLKNLVKYADSKDKLRLPFDATDALKTLVNEYTQNAYIQRLNALYTVQLLSTDDFDLMLDGLSFFIEQGVYNEAILLRLQTLPRGELSEQKFARFKFLLADFAANTHDVGLEREMLESAMRESAASRGTFANYHERLSAIYVAHSDEEGEQKLRAYLSEHDDGTAALSQANEIALSAISPLDTVSQKLSLLRKSALRGNKAAVDELKLIVALNKYPEACLVLSEVYEELGTATKGSVSADTPFLYPKDEGPDSLIKAAKSLYEEALKSRNPGIFQQVASLRYEGRVFEKNDFLARSLFSIANESAELDVEGKTRYARMCLYGEGGAVDLALADTLLSSINYSDRSPATSFMLAEIHFNTYLYHRESDLVTAQLYLGFAVNDYHDAAHKNDENSIISLYILFVFYKSEAAKNALLALPQDKGELCRFLGQSGASSKELSLLFPEHITLEEEDSEIMSQITAAELELERGRPLGLRLVIESLPDDSPFRDALKERLLEYYRGIEQGVFRLIATLCYEADRHKGEFENPFEHRSCQVLLELIEAMNSAYAGKELEFFQEHLRQMEIQHGTFFDETDGEDSDDEDEVTYQGGDRTVTADWVRSDELTGSLENPTLKLLHTIMGKKEASLAKNEESREKLVRAIKRNFTDAQIYKPNSRAAPKEIVEQQLETLNFHVARGEWDIAMRLISVNFCVIQTRGIHMITQQWPRWMRQKYHRTVKDKSHPFQNLALYSSAVYAHAGVTDFTAADKITQALLQKSARFVHQQTLKLESEEPLKEEDLSEEVSEGLRKALFRASTETKGMQAQQVYSNEYGLFHEFLGHESSRADKDKLPNTKNPYVSTADGGSRHASAYAFGKPYEADMGSRSYVSAHFKANGRASWRVCGATILTFHPLEDFATGDHHHVLSLNMHAKLSIKEVVLPEAETSFFAYIIKGRAKFILSAKRPSFHREAYYKIFHYKYGLTEPLYRAFQEAIKTSKPHSVKRQLTLMLLDDYIGAYQSRYLLRHAHEYARKKHKVLLFRNPEGTFSLSPRKYRSPMPVGFQPDAVLRRAESRKTRAADTVPIVEATPPPTDPSADPSTPDSAHRPAKRVRTSGNTFG